MGKHFLSVLGTGEYKKAIYSCDGRKVETPYVQEALLKLKFDTWEPEDKISIFLTEKAKQDNWEDREYRDKEKEAAKHELPEIRKGLKSVLQKDYSVFLDEAEKCMLPIGANEEELWEIFQVIFSRIQDNEELYIDITHSLRNIPIQMLAVVSYARVLKNVTVKGIYYGAFETKDQFGGETPILDLATFLDILDWSQAANAFVKYGNSDQIFELYEEQKKKAYKDKMQKGKTQIYQRDLQKVVTEIHNITSGLETSRGYYDFKENKTNKATSVMGAYKAYKATFEIMNKKDNEKKERKEKQRNIIEPLGELLKVIDDKAKIFDVESNLDFGLAAVQWAIDNKSTQQGFTALEETVKTFLCNYYELDETQQIDREGICKNICGILYEECCKKQKNANNFELRVQICENWLNKNREVLKITQEKEEKICRIFKTLPTTLLEIVHEIGNRRNSMNHFGYSNLGKFSSEKLESDLKLYYKEFQEVMEKMKNEI